LCFNTSMTGYQEIMTDPSYAGHAITFTFPHIGNTGITTEDNETANPVARAMIIKSYPTEPSNYRSKSTLPKWLEETGRIGVSGIDTRRLTRAIRMQGAPHVAIAHHPEGEFDVPKLLKAARNFVGLEGLDLAKDVTCSEHYNWNETRWEWPNGFSND
ncbi:MAG: carbamoyl-phosphate synthase domain-containing protein, partial [Rhodobacterales bacterium]